RQTDFISFCRSFYTGNQSCKAGDSEMTPEEIKVKKWLQRAFYADKKIKSLDMLLKAFKMHAEGLDGTRQLNILAGLILA
ncbi:MAG: hypothetical protein K2K02_00850, partial [Ruminococcus sp.]|nr:hypothetical protein [Ruminococcus sp.]